MSDVGVSNFGPTMSCRPTCRQHVAKPTSHVAHFRPRQCRVVSVGSRHVGFTYIGTSTKSTISLPVYGRDLVHKILFVRVHTFIYVELYDTPRPTYCWKAEIAPVTAMVLVYYGPTVSICDKWAESDSVFLKSGTRLVTNFWPEN
jgi:hypothetical protein